MDRTDKNRIRENPRDVRLQQRMALEEDLNAIYAWAGIFEIEMISGNFPQRGAIFLQYQPHLLLGGSYFDMQVGTHRCVAATRKLAGTMTAENSKRSGSPAPRIQLKKSPMRMAASGSD